MIQLHILSGRKAGTQVVARRLPFSVGRAPQSGLVLEDEGVWNHHLSIGLQDQGAVVSAGPESLVAVNGESVRQAPLRNGDLIELGSVKLRFGLSPTRQRRLWLRESVTWVALAAVSLAQVALIYYLLAE